MALHPRAGQRAVQEELVDLKALLDAYADRSPDPAQPSQRVAFGTSGHRGSSLQSSFNEAHVASIAQAICDYRVAHEISGPLFVGADTHALSGPAQQTALEVLAANGVQACVAGAAAYTSTPAISFAVITYNAKGQRKADGIVITPSHNPPQDGGFKYNPPHGGPAEKEVTDWIEQRANALLAQADAIKRQSEPRRADCVQEHDFITPYLDALHQVVDIDAIVAGRVRIGVDPLGGAGVAVWAPMAERLGIDVQVVSAEVDPRFGFMTLDKDGQIRMDCSSPYAMARLVALKDRYDIAVGNDPDGDRHGIVTRSWGLLNPNHFLAVAVDYLFSRRKDWPASAAVGKTLVSSGMIDRVAARLKRELVEVPVGFKWFVDGLLSGRCGFGGEESAGASFLRRDGRPWTTDKDGFIMALLAAEITAVRGLDPGECYDELVREFGEPVYERIDAPAKADERTLLANLRPEAVTAKELAGDAITQVLTHAPGNGAAIGGLKVVTAHGWFAARPSGTEPVYKIYAESFRGRGHLERIQQEAQRLVSVALAKA